MSVADIAPFPVKPASRICRYVSHDVVSCQREDDTDDRERDDERANGNRDGKPPGLNETTLELHVRVPPGHEQADLLDRRGSSLELADDAALVDDEDPVGERANLVEVFAHEQDRDALRSGVAEVRVHGLDRADVEPARRLRDDEDERIVRELAPEDELLGFPPERSRTGVPGRASSRRSGG